MPHLVQVMAYMRLELRHEIFDMQLWSDPVVKLVMWPVLFSRSQYLQCFRLQKWKPLLVGSVPSLLALWIGFWEDGETLVFS